MANFSMAQFGCLSLAAAFLLLSGGCRTLPADGAVRQYLAISGQRDLWSSKIESWQKRQKEASSVQASIAAVSGAPLPEAVSASPAFPGLLDEYKAYRAERRRALVRDLVTWIQQQSEDRYIADGAIDHWATFEETLQRGGDDCDGLELLAYRYLRDLGFSEEEVFRAIIYRPSDAQHHMVTLWFEDENDPWVIDPTSTAAHRLVRMSELPNWVPLKLFSEDAEYTVRQLGPEKVPTTMTGVLRSRSARSDKAGFQRRGR